MRSTPSIPDKAIFDELRSVVEGPVLDDEVSRVLFSSGACLFQVRPLGVVQPKNKADVMKVVEYAARREIPLTARGAGTSRTGNELGHGIILDFSRYMNHVLEFDPTNRWVRVQPGIILSSLNSFLKPSNLFFPIDPSTMEFCTLGGMIANNSSGPHAVKYGTTRGHVLSLEVVLSNGEVIMTGPISLKGETMQTFTGSSSREGKIYRELPALLERYREPLKKERPFTVKNSSGYDLWMLQKGQSLDLTPLIVGSEGTLGIVTEARLALAPTPGKTLSGLLYFGDLDHVGRATQCILELSPSMVEIMERQILDLARNQIDELRPYIPDGIEGVLYVEFQEEDEESCRYKFRSVEKKIKQQEKLATDLRIAENHGDMAIFSKIRSISGPILSKIRGPKKPWAFIEDTAVHPTHLPEYIRGLRGLFQKYEVDFSIYGHAGDGNLHIMVFLDLRQAQEVEKMMALTDDCYDLVLRLNGTISAEHGDGRLRTYYLKKQYPNLYPAMVEIKELFDPDNILNPGCIVGARQNPLNRHLKFGDDYRVSKTGSTFDGEAARTEIETCSGCGKCRSYCPIAQQYHEEWAMGRGKTILLKEVISGRIDRKILDSPGFRKIVDSCINCKRCLEDCPSGVDIPWLAIAGRAHYLTKHGDSLSNRLITDTRLLCKTASVFGPLVNLANSWAPFRQCLESTVGLDRRRQLPLFQRKSLGGPAKGLDQPKGGKEIVYFASCFSDLNDRWPDGSATVEVLQHNGFRVLMPDFHCCGIARISAGSTQRAIEDIQCNVDMMRYYVEKGIKIVFDEPSCALAVKIEYPKILNSELSNKISENCYDIHQFLMTLHERDELRLDLKKMKRTVGYHNPCHLRALGITKEPVELLQLIPGVRVKVFSDRCCGLAGTFGMKKRNFDASMGIGSKLFEEIRDAGVDEIATSCAACKLQTRQGTGKPALDPISLLAEAYAR